MRTILNYRAGAAVAARHIVKFGSGDTAVLQGAASTDLLIGVSTELPVASGARCDVVHHGPTEVLFGGAVTRGQKLTSDANGKAVAASPASGVKAQIIGIALVTAADGDIGLAFISPSTLTG